MTDDDTYTAAPGIAWSVEQSETPPDTDPDEDADVEDNSGLAEEEEPE